jgi:hypothetical protein
VYAMSASNMVTRLQAVLARSVLAIMVAEVVVEAAVGAAVGAAVVAVATGDPNVTTATRRAIQSIIVGRARRSRIQPTQPVSM